MAVNEFILIAILLGFVVSWVPRVLPFVLVKYKGLPDIVVRFLHYLPVSILFALILSSLTTEKIGHLPQFKWMEILATVPTVIKKPPSTEITKFQLAPRREKVPVVNAVTAT